MKPANSPKSKLLFDEHPLCVIPQLAVLIGLNEAIVLQQVHYWVTLNEKGGRNLQDGHHWTYNTYKAWQQQFPFWSIRTIKTIVSNLERSGLLIAGNYNKLRQDRTKWYRINHDACTLQSATPAPTSEDKDCTLQGEETAPPLPETTPKITSKTRAEEESNSNDPTPGKIFTIYEQNIGMLTPLIAEEIKSALDTFPVDWIEEAITISARANKRSWRYIEGILRSWATGGKDVAVKDLTQAPQNEAIIANLDAINEIFRKELIHEQDAQFLGGLMLESNIGTPLNLYKIFRCLKGLEPVTNGVLKEWRRELEKLGLEL